MSLADKIQADLDAAFDNQVEDLVEETDKQYEAAREEAVKEEAEEVVEEEFSEAAEAMLVSTRSAASNKSKKSKKSDSFNMFNIADEIYSENTSDDNIETEEERPVIKVERVRQVDVINEPEPEVEPILKLSFKDQYRLWIHSGKYKEDLKTALPFLIGFVALVIILYNVVMNVDFGGEEPEVIPEQSIEEVVIEEQDLALSIEEIVEPNLKTSKRADAMALHKSIRYKEIDKEALQGWLVNRKSLLAEEEYFNTIVEVAEDYGVNPLFLFAITGQEQNFVQSDHEDAKAMVNNPFNVYVSWEDYNTDIEESAQIASRTIHTLSEGLPEGENPIRWINRKYAEDEKWHEGVTLILKQLEAVAGNPK